MQLKIIPVVQWLVVVGIMYTTYVALPQSYFPEVYALSIAVFLFIVAGFVGVSAVIEFKKHATTVNPTTPEKASKLVTTGIFKITRNPMYLALLILLVAWGVYLQSLYNLLPISGFIMYVTQFQIMPEENALVELFGDEYKAYQKNVRRWI